MMVCSRRDIACWLDRFSVFDLATQRGTGQGVCFVAVQGQVFDNPYELGSVLCRT